MEKRSIITIILIFLILLLWPILVGKRKQVKEVPKEEKRQVVQEQERPPLAQEPKILPVSRESIILVQTPLYEAQLTREGARIISWKLKDYMNRTGEPGYIDLIPTTAQNCLSLRFNDAFIQKEIDGAPWNCDKKHIFLSSPEDEASLVFEHTTSRDIKIQKKLTFYGDKYIIGVTVRMYDSLTGKGARLGYDILWGAGISEDSLVSPQELANEGPIAMLNTTSGPKLVRHWVGKGVGCFGGKQVQVPPQDGAIHWVSFAGKYFTAVLIPTGKDWWSDNSKAGKRYVIINPTFSESISPKDVWNTWGKNTHIGLTVPASDSPVQNFMVYIGPKKWDILNGIKNDGNKLMLGRMIDFGMFSPLGKTALWLLQFFYKSVKNYGLAIVLLAVLIKIIYLPLTQKSFNSMNKMQELQPKLAQLREKYRDDPQRLNKETMKFYKQYGASPWGGCLPILLQIPVFWALFSTLRTAVELRGASFIPGWINDLSLPDTVASIAGIPIRILPLLLTGSTILQQFIFGSGGSGQSNKAMVWMPVFMLFIFYGMPSGLVLYWLCNDIFSFAHRIVIKKLKDRKNKEQTIIDEKVSVKPEKGKNLNKRYRTWR